MAATRLKINQKCNGIKTHYSIVFKLFKSNWKRRYCVGSLVRLAHHRISNHNFWLCFTPAHVINISKELRLGRRAAQCFKSIVASLVQFSYCNFRTSNCIIKKIYTGMF